jgi:hypothetical protein
VKPDLLLDAIADALEALTDESADEGNRIWEAAQILEAALEEVDY